MAQSEKAYPKCKQPMQQGFPIDRGGPRWPNGLKDHAQSDGSAYGGDARGGCRSLPTAVFPTATSSPMPTLCEAVSGTSVAGKARNREAIAQPVHERRAEWPCVSRRFHRQMWVH